MPINRLKPGHLAKLPPGTHGDGHGRVHVRFVVLVAGFGVWQDVWQF